MDEFKTVNDTYGHQAGDRVLVGLARALEGALRQGDELYRIGGDEFVAVIEVRRTEEAVRHRRAADRGGPRHRAHDQRRRGPAASPASPPELTLRRADQALYAVKRHGRDGVRLAAA